MVMLSITKKTDSRLLSLMQKHYSHPNGFVGRSICYAISYDNIYYGHIVPGSATLYLPNRNEFFGITKHDLNKIVNNIFFHVEPVNGKYPCRNFVPKIIRLWRKSVMIDWFNKYGDEVIGFETLVELPRTGECYRRDGWKQTGQTKGFTCKRVAGKGTDSWGGRRVWDYKNLRPKIVLVRFAN